MWEEFQKLLDFDKDEDLQRMYALLSRIPEGLEPLRKKFEEHVKRAGLAAVQKLVGEGEAGANGGGAGAETLDPKAYVDALLDVHKKNQETVNRSFKGEAGFVASLDKVGIIVDPFGEADAHGTRRLAVNSLTGTRLLGVRPPSLLSYSPSMPMPYSERTTRLLKIRIWRRLSTKW